VTHFDITQWSDFTRGIGEQAVLAAMEQHLDKGCGKCQHTAATMNSVSSTAMREKEFPVPANVVHFARSIFVLQMPEKVNLLPRIAARLLYDSFRDPLPAGLRSQHHLSRQTLYEAGQYHVDLKLDHERGARNISLVGQIVDQQDPGKTCGGVPIFLLSGRNEIVAKSISNRQGEFRMEYEPKKDLHLVVDLNEDNVIDLPAKDFGNLDGQPSGSRRGRK
jgi:hypothetical protein